MNKLQKNLLTAITVSLLFMNCSETPIAPETTTTTTPTTSAKQVNFNEFDINLFKAVLESSPVDRNVVISPISVSTVIKMVLAGANNRTETEIINAYGKSASKASLLEDGKSFLEWLKDRKGQPTITLSNAFFYDTTNVYLLDGYKEKMSEYFHAAEFAEDFSNEQDALLKINRWVNEQTKTRIPKILNDISPDEVMFLVNALYLKADWEQGFDAKETRKSDFTLTNGTVKKVEFMKSDRNLNYFGDEQLEAIELPYKDKEISMYFIKAKSKNLAEIMTNFTASRFEDIVKNMASKRFNIEIPKFEIAYTNESMINPLKQLGIKDAFTTYADLSLMSEKQKTFINRVIHATFLTIDEKGTEGAAVTAGGLSVTSEPPTIKFNSPFVIFLATKKSNNILFSGRINNP